MTLSIESDEAERLGRELAELTGESITLAVTVAIRERLERMRADGAADERRVARILALGGQIAAALPPSVMDVDDLYDDDGLPASLRADGGYSHHPGGSSRASASESVP